MLKKGDLVYCAGEGTDIYIIVEIGARCAWLDGVTTNLPCGWEGLEKIKKISSKQIENRITETSEQITLLRAALKTLKNYAKR